MHHVVQEQMFNEFGFQTLIRALKDNGCEYTVAKVVPHARVGDIVESNNPGETYAHELEFNPETRVMVWGSLTLDGIARDKDWKPGHFGGENFDYRVQLKKWGKHMLNWDAQFCKFEELNITEPTFIRPVHDTKTFTGMVVHPDEFTAWRDKILSVSNTGYSMLSPDTEVLYAAPKQVDFEARLFIVDGVVVSGSSYRNFGQVFYKRIDSQNVLFYPAMEFAKNMHEMWYWDFATDVLLPFITFDKRPLADAYVMDVARLEDGQHKVIEVNSMNSSGFYETDMAEVVRALEVWDEGKVRQIAWEQELAKRPRLNTNF